MMGFYKLNKTIGPTIRAHLFNTGHDKPCKTRLKTGMLVKVCSQKITFMGMWSEKQILAGKNQIDFMLEPLGYRVVRIRFPCHGFKTKLGFRIDLKGLDAYCKALYLPQSFDLPFHNVELFSGFKFKLKQHSLCATLFHTGSLNITGANEYNAHLIPEFLTMILCLSRICSKKE